MEKLVTWKGEKERKPLLLLGVRQVGKTYILKEFGSHHFPHYHYINFEKELKAHKIFEADLNPKRILEELSFYFDHSIDISTDLLIFDEIQACPNALTSLKYFQEELPQSTICGAGSLLGIHLTPSSFPVGKVSMLTLHPMTFEEFLLANNDNKSLEVLSTANKAQSIPEVIHLHLWEQLKHYFVVGGMPEAISTYCGNKDNLFNAFSLVREKQDHLLTAYYADMAKHSGKINAMHIDRVFRSIPSQLEKGQDGEAKRFVFKGVIPGISHYHRLANVIDWLAAAGLIIKVFIVENGYPPFKAHTKENVFKLFLFDVGMLGMMSGLSPKAILEYDYGSYKGYFAENYVAQALLAAKKQEFFCWMEKKAEVEFLVDVEGTTIPVEVKSGKVIKAKSLKVFAEKYHPPFCIILSGASLSSTGAMRFYPLYLTGQIFDFPLSFPS